MIKHNKITKIFFITVITLVATVGVCFGALCIYTYDYYKVLNRDEVLAGSLNVIVNDEADYYFVDGPGVSQAMIFYPGAKVEESAYLPIMKLLAENGVDCFVVKMPFKLAMFGINRASEIISDYTYDEWYLSGHSLGGAMACYYLADNYDKFSGMFLFASYSTADLTDVDFPIVSIYGSEDKVLQKDVVEAARYNMPSSYREVVIEGGNHAFFGDYGNQKGDGKATITKEEQWDIVVDSIISTLAK